MVLVGGYFGVYKMRKPEVDLVIDLRPCDLDFLPAGRKHKRKHIHRWGKTFDAIWDWLPEAFVHYIICSRRKKSKHGRKKYISLKNHK